MLEASSRPTESIISTLAEIRTLTQRSPERVANLGQELIERGWLKGRRIGDDVWPTLEQIAIAALECGRIKLAEVCATRLSSRFPDSPRVGLLLGELLEANGLSEQAKEYYERILEDDETDTPIRKRLISLHLHSGNFSESKKLVVSDSAGGARSPQSKLSRSKGVTMLVEYLDCFYNDLEGWAELASVYASMGLYTQSLTALSHLILLSPHNPYHLLQHAETAYTGGDFLLSYKEFLRVIEMSDGMQGAGRRAAFGLKVCIARIESRGTTGTSDPVFTPRKLKEIDLMVTKMLLQVYRASEGALAGEVVQKWIGGA